MRTFTALTHTSNTNMLHYQKWKKGVLTEMYPTNNGTVTFLLPLCSCPFCPLLLANDARILRWGEPHFMGIEGKLMVDGTGGNYQIGGLQWLEQWFWSASWRGFCFGGSRFFKPSRKLDCCCLLPVQSIASAGLPWYIFHFWSSFKAGVMFKNCHCCV
jgi:hypothetical protein